MGAHDVEQGGFPFVRGEPGQALGQGALGWRCVVQSAAAVLRTGLLRRPWAGVGRRFRARLRDPARPRWAVGGRGADPEPLTLEGIGGKRCPSGIRSERGRPAHGDPVGVDLRERGEEPPRSTVVAAQGTDGDDVTPAAGATCVADAVKVRVIDGLADSHGQDRVGAGLDE